MKKLALLLLLICLCLPATIWAQCVVGLESAGPDQATMEAYNWRSANVYPYYQQSGFQAVIVAQSSTAKLLDAIANNNVTHITGCGHGSPTDYTGYNMQTVLTTSNPTVLAKLSGMHVHLLSCLTAQKLGPAIISNGAKSFAGYYPSFYFTWQSTGKFFDADAEIDRQFAAGKTAPEAYNVTIDAFNKLIADLQTSEPSAVDSAITDRDGLRCFPSRDGQPKLETVLSLDYAHHVLYAQDPGSRGFLTFVEYKNAKTRGVSFGGLSAQEFKNLVLAKYERYPRDFALGIISYGKFSRDQIIDEIKNDTVLGKQLVDMAKNCLKVVSESRWSKSIDVTTDENGAISASGSANLPITVTVTGVKGIWSGTLNKFSNVSVTLDGESLFNGEVTNNTEYKVTKHVESGDHTYDIKATGGPANTKVTVTLYFDLGK